MSGKTFLCLLNLLPLSSNLDQLSIKILRMKDVNIRAVFCSLAFNLLGDFDFIFNVNCLVLVILVFCSY